MILLENAAQLEKRLFSIMFSFELPHFLRYLLDEIQSQSYIHFH